MKITLEELKELSKKIKIDFEEEELKDIQKSILKITDKIEDLMEENVDGIEQTRTNAKEKQTFNNVENENNNIDLSKINNVEDDFVVIENKGESNE